MKRTFELEARANDVGYSITLRINGRAFAASAIVANGDTVGSTYKQIVTQLAEVYGSIERKLSTRTLQQREMKHTLRSVR